MLELGVVTIKLLKTIDIYEEKTTLDDATEFNKTFRDTNVEINTNEIIQKREKIINGKVFYISSHFSSNPKVTPFEKLLSVVENSF